MSDTDKKNVSLTQWSKDFPINVGEDNYVARRDFTKFMVLTSFAFVVGQVWIGALNIIRRKTGKPATRPIATLGSLSAGTSLQFAYPGPNDPCLLVRLDETHFVAYSQKCTHLSCAVIPQHDQGSFHCPCHNGSFDMATGKPLAGPPRRPLPRITLDIRGENIYATGVEVSTT
jgi:nitrite reductase/ring-hydroxylating ferredoxin subunit